MVKIANVIAGHQPNYLPYLGFFDKIKKSDIFFILDDAQFSKGDFHNRNKIMTLDNGPKWLTIPIEKKRIPLNEIRIKDDVEFSNMLWSRYHQTIIQQNYAQAKFFENYFTDLEDLYTEAAKQGRNLAENNMLFIDFFCDVFGINVPRVLASTLSISTPRTQRIVDICKALKGDTYLSGDGARDYLEEKLFEDNGIKLVYQNYKHPEYPQLNGEFVPFMSAVDYLLNCGRKML